MIRFSLQILVCMIAAIGPASAAPALFSLPAPHEAVVNERVFQHRLVLEQRFLNEFRLNSIQFRLGRAALPFCGNATHAEFGLRVTTGAVLPANERMIAQEGFGFDDKLRVQHVVPKSPAHEAGLHSGDRIVRIGGTPVLEGPDGLATFDMASNDSRLSLVVTRKDVRSGARKTFSVTLNAVTVCNLKVQLTDDPTIGSQAASGTIVVSKGMMWFAGDDQLAFVIGHEFAHVLGHHIQLVQSGVPQSEAEKAADYLGLYIMARAGYDVTAAPAFFRRVAANFPRMIAMTSDHPGTPYRYVALTETVHEIKSKIALGLSLLPNNMQTASRAGS